MDNIEQNKVRFKLDGILPRLSRFAMVLTGDEESGDGLLAVFCARIMFTDTLPVESEDFTAGSFAELYLCWLEQIEAGVITTHIHEQDNAIYKPGEFPSDQDPLVLETGAFLVSLLPQHRAALLLVYGEGFTYAQAATIMKLKTAELTLSLSGASSKLAGPDRFERTPRAAPPSQMGNAKTGKGTMDGHGTFLSQLKAG